MNENMNASNLLCQGSRVPFVSFQHAVGKSHHFAFATLSLLCNAEESSSLSFGVC